jgi:hypothetical protein
LSRQFELKGRGDLFHYFPKSSNGRE